MSIMYYIKVFILEESLYIEKYILLHDIPQNYAIKKKFYSTYMNTNL